MRCEGAQYDGYFALAAPLLDQMALIAKEAQQLQDLPAERREALLAAVLDLRASMETIPVPECLAGVHSQALAAGALLQETLEAIGRSEFATATETLQEAYEALAEALALYAMGAWKLTATTTPTP
jgi:hypothetical protein